MFSEALECSLEVCYVGAEKLMSLAVSAGFQHKEGFELKFKVILGFLPFLCLWCEFSFILPSPVP